MLKVCVSVLIKGDNQTGMKGWQPFLHKLHWLDLIYILALYYSYHKGYESNATYKGFL